jgi:hypothetical protein
MRDEELRQNARNANHDSRITPFPLALASGG